jgi:ribosomal protein S18 acetylase RimI-like enzyme
VYLASRKRLVPFAPLAHGDEDVCGWISSYLVPSGNVIVAVLGEQIVGMCATSLEEGAGWIEHLYVLPDHIGKGIGTHLLNNALQQLPLPVRLYTFQENRGARRFYERHGFVAVAFGDGSGNEEGVPDVLYELHRHADT